MRPIDLHELRARLAARFGLDGRSHWRSLEELADTEEFQSLLHREFPDEASEFTDPIGRRRFIQLMGASLALAGLAGCTRQPAEKILPYVRAPEEIVPGKPLFYATAMTMAGIANGILVESHMGHPTKVEGNPQHPASLGATDVFAQASILSLYDPDRSQTLKHLGEIRPWGLFVGAIQSALASQRPYRGAGLRLLTETVTSPTLADQIRSLLAQFPAARWHQYEPAGRDAARAGARLAFGEAVEARYRIENAGVILSLDSDFLATGPGALRYAREFARRRAPSEPASRMPEMNRLYAVESTPTPTGAKADHRLPLRASAVEPFARLLADRIGATRLPGRPMEPGLRALGDGSLPAEAQKWIDVVSRDLEAHRGSCVVIPGEYQTPALHALAHAMNVALDNVGSTVEHTDPVEVEPVDQNASLSELAEEMESGRVAMLVILGGNPAYTAPPDFRFTERLAKVPLRIHLSLYEDETSEQCHWHVPEAHFLEAWGDARAYDGTVSIIQPLISPLYNEKSAYEILSVFLSKPDRNGYEIVRDHWMRTHARENAGGGSASGNHETFERFWRSALHEGFVAGSALPPKSVPLAVAPAPPSPSTGTPGAVEGIEIIFRPDPTVFDGRFANNGWLQELPKPLTKITWDNAALISPATAGRLGLQNRQLVELSCAGRSVLGAVWILPGHPADSVTVHLGYGRRRAGQVGTGGGFDAYALRASDALWIRSGARIRKTDRQGSIVTTQDHHAMEGRNLVRSAALGEYRANPSFAHAEGEEPPRDLSMYPEHEHSGYAWGMSIDLNACIGCNACVLACQSENNIPVVGKDQVAAGREMHWLRIDRYYSGDLDNPEALHQPVLCMQCENAPCEVVCPVGATVHSPEGLNEMVYNRCVGTRYCSNNCPYKVRRFNFFLYSDFTTPSLKMLRNPDVTVRSRGVMEKCTYCVQRINSAKIEAENEDRDVRDGEIVTACQAACPTEAIVFGNINDPESGVARRKADPRNYGLLSELNTRPRTSYLAALRNPNPELS